MVAFTFYRGKWGSGQPAEPVAAADEHAIFDMMTRAGQRITFAGSYLAIFTATGVNETIHIKNTSCHLPGTIFDSNKQHIVSLLEISKTITDIDKCLSGMTYVIYAVDSGFSLRRDQFYTNDGADNFVIKLIGYTKPVSVLRRTGLTTDEVMMTPGEICAKIGEGIVFYSAPYSTWISYESKHEYDAYGIQYKHLSYSKRAMHVQRLNVELNRLANNGKTLYIYGTTYNGMLPRIHAPHLEALRGILLSDAQIDTYAVGDQVPADEKDITYDDDGYA